MPCDTRLKTGQTISQRKDEVRKAATAIDKLIASRQAQVRVGPQGAVTFVGIPEDVRDGLTDACVYRRIMASGSAGAKMALLRAEQLAGRSIDRRVVAGGTHSHDGGTHWHGKG